METQNWWAYALRGFIAVLYGILVLVWPGTALFSLTMLFGAWALVEGVLAIIGAIVGNGAKDQHRWLLAVEGLVSIVLGFLTFARPGATMIALLVVIGIWAILRGGLAIASAIRLRKVITGEWLLGFSGAITILFGLLIFASPRAGALAVAGWLGIYAIVFGVSLIALGFRLRSISRGAPPTGQDLGGPVVTSR
jgi:uncharacterized membrane protein HdeD (DUF308 family)